jgi:hypothetical protein
LGRYRCERIVFEGKDANDDLISGILEKSINNTVKYPVAGTFKVSDCYDDIIALMILATRNNLSKDKCFWA